MPHFQHLLWTLPYVWHYVRMRFYALVLVLMLKVTIMHPLPSLKPSLYGTPLRDTAREGMIDRPSLDHLWPYPQAPPLGSPHAHLPDYLGVNHVTPPLRGAAPRLSPRALLAGLNGPNAALVVPLGLPSCRALG